MGCSKDKTLVGAVVVLYNPEREQINSCLSSLAEQVDKLCFVDNSPVDNTGMIDAAPSDVVYKPLMYNSGIAVAQNVGIRYFQELGYEFVLFCDQDSVVPTGCVGKMLEAYTSLSQHGYNVGAVGSRAINKQTGKPYHAFSKEINVIGKEVAGCGFDITECYSLISSISLIPIVNFDEVGGMDESLFIDGVDHEWCWRAWHKAGLRSFIAEGATIGHQIGIGDRTMATKRISISSPFRLYYQLRNYLWLRRRDYVPNYWKNKNLKKYAMKIVYYPLFASPRLRYLKSIVRGISDGLFKYKEGEPKWQNFQNKND